jgi:hypothetical protein
MTWRHSLLGFQLCTVLQKPMSRSNEAQRHQNMLKCMCAGATSAHTCCTCLQETAWHCASRLLAASFGPAHRRPHCLQRLPFKHSQLDGKQQPNLRRNQANVASSAMKRCSCPNITAITAQLAKWRKAKQYAAACPGSCSQLLCMLHCLPAVVAISKHSSTDCKETATGGGWPA